MPPIAHPGRLLRRELAARGLSANRLALDLGVPSGCVTDILNDRRGVTADTALRLGRNFGSNLQFWLELQSQYDIAVVAGARRGDRAAGQAGRRRLNGQAGRLRAQRLLRDS